MALDVAVPTPPDITNRTVPEMVNLDALPGSDLDLRRAELERILREGAWREGFEEWAQYTDLSEADVGVAVELGLFRGLDFFWDGEAERLRYVVPAVPEEWDERTGPDGVPASRLQEELDELAQTVSESIATDYVAWGEAESSDLVWGVETFGQVPTVERE
jgi:hypothetical protein